MRVKDEKLRDYMRTYSRGHLIGGNFLENLFLNITHALRPSPALYLTQKQIDENLDAAKRAVRVLKDSPLNYSYSLDHAFALVDGTVKEKLRYSIGHQGSSSEDVVKVLGALGSLKRELEQIQKASVIVYAKNVTKGKKIHCVLDEIWSKSKDANFTLKPGDKLPMLEHDVEPNTSYGQGQIVFFKAGSPSFYSASWSVHRDKVSTFNNMDLDQVKEIVKSMKGSSLELPPQK